jgi:hypothetical protein
MDNDLVFTDLVLRSMRQLHILAVVSGDSLHWYLSGRI